MPRTMLLLPTSTTRRLDINDRVLRHDQVAGADRHDFVAVAHHRAPLIVDADPGAVDGAFADHRCDAIAGFVHRQRTPLRQDRLAVEGPAQASVEVLDERLDGLRDAAECALRNLADGDGVRPRVIANRIDVDSNPDDEECPIVLYARLDENPGNLPAVDKDVVRPLDARVDGKYIT